VISGALLQHYCGAVFVFTLPLAAIALVMALLYVPSHVNESTNPIDNLGGVLSIVLVAALILASTSRPCPTRRPDPGAGGRRGGRDDRLRRAPASRRQPPLQLHIAGRRIFWVAALGGIIVFGR